MNLSDNNPFRPPGLLGNGEINQLDDTDRQWWYLPALVTGFAGFVLAVYFIEEFDRSDAARIVRDLLIGRLVFVGWTILGVSAGVIAFLVWLFRLSRWSLLVLSAVVTATSTLAAKFILDGHLH